MLVATKRIELLSTASETVVLPLDEVAIAMPALSCTGDRSFANYLFLVRYYIVHTDRTGSTRPFALFSGSGRNRTASYEIRIGAE